MNFISCSFQTPAPSLALHTLQLTLISINKVVFKVISNYVYANNDTISITIVPRGIGATFICFYLKFRVYFKKILNKEQTEEVEDRALEINIQHNAVNKATLP